MQPKKLYDDLSLDGVDHVCLNERIINSQQSIHYRQVRKISKYHKHSLRLFA